MPAPKNLIKYKLWIKNLKISHLGQIPINKGKKTNYIPKNAFKKGRIPWNKGLKTGYNKKQADKCRGKKWSEETKKRINMSEIKKGKKPYKITDTIRKNMSISQIKRKKRDGFTHSIVTRKKLSESLKGEKSPNYKGGLGKLEEKIRKIFEYKLWRENIFKKYNFICQKCKEKGGKLRVHHVNNFSAILRKYNIKIIENSINCQKLWDRNNGIIFCKECHNKFHKLYGKENNNRRQLNEFLNTDMIYLDILLKKNIKLYGRI
jgi:hypothetical protein